jgi:hypothetical protein
MASNRHTPLSSDDLDELLEREKTIDDIVREISEAFRQEAAEIMSRPVSAAKGSTRQSQSQDKDEA